MDISKEEILNLIGKSDPIILDIGSHSGKDASELSQLFDAPEIHCFEADPVNQENWKALNGLNRKMTLYNTAVGNVDHPITFNQSTKSSSGSLYKPKTHLDIWPDVHFNKQVKVMCFKLDTWNDYVLQNQLIDFIWCDVNGAEKEVINGAKKTLKNTRYLYIEFSDKELYEGQITKHDLLSLLPDFEELAVYNYEGNFGNLLLKNKLHE